MLRQSRLPKLNFSEIKATSTKETRLGILRVILLLLLYHAPILHCTRAAAVARALGIEAAVFSPGKLGQMLE